MEDRKKAPASAWDKLCRQKKTMTWLGFGLMGAAFYCLLQAAGSGKHTLLYLGCMLGAWLALRKGGWAD